MKKLNKKESAHLRNSILEILEKNTEIFGYYEQRAVGEGKYKKVVDEIFNKLAEQDKLKEII